MIPQETRDLAQQLLAHETAAGKAPETTESAAVRVCERLRQPVCGLAGVAGYRTLLSRALALARAEVPGLSRLQVTADGSLQSLGELQPQIDQDHAEEGGVILIAQLLGLFLTFLGAALTLQLVQNVSPHFKVATEADTPVPFGTILQEARQLKDVSKRLVSLADQHPLVEEALMSISGNIRDTATLLEVFVQIRSKSEAPRKDMPKKQAEPYKM